MSELQVNISAISEIAAQMDLREPNRDALETVVVETSRYYDLLGGKRPFEAVVDAATGVGKTHVMAAIIEYYATVHGYRDFAVITPGRTILRKTASNFTPGNPKSLLPKLTIHPTVITADNFNSQAARTAMVDPNQVKIYIFTVQALTKPQTNMGRRTHVFQEGLGTAFYHHLANLPHLVVFADEHHCYYGPAFSHAIRDLAPWVLIGLTATPHPKTPPEQIIFRYPLAAAIADHLVKTPVLVGRKDDRRDPVTKLTDGVSLLERKAEAMRLYCDQTGKQYVNPVMLVVAQGIQEAEEYASIIRSPTFFGGSYADSVLVIHSDVPDEALAELERVEQPNSPVRIIISVGMLKEGWDVKNVYVIASMRASISEILTEQTLGRGLRLPFGEYTGIEMLDTLEVVAHERYEQLLRRAGVINEALVDYRVRSRLLPMPLTTGQAGTSSMPLDQGEVASANVPVATVDDRTVTAAGGEPPAEQGVASAGAEVAPAHESRSRTEQAPQGMETPMTAAEAVAGFTRPSALPVITTVRVQEKGSVIEVVSVEERQKAHEATSRALAEPLRRLPNMPPIQVPQLQMKTVASPFSLADITDLSQFRRLGMTLAVNPEQELRRTLLQARVVTDADGIKRTELIMTAATDRVVSHAQLLSMEYLTEKLLDTLLNSPLVPARLEERHAAMPLIEAFFEGLGSKAQEVLSVYFDVVAARLLKVIADEQRRFAPKPVYTETVQLVPFDPVRIRRSVTSEDRVGKFVRGCAYEGWRRSLFEQAWFDSAPERDLANLLDDSAQIRCWARLHRGDLPILWSSAGKWYHPDFLVLEVDQTHWVVEVKANREMESVDVRAKREAAMRWANHVSADPAVGTRWRYLLVSEQDVIDAKGSWEQLKHLGLF